MALCPVHRGLIAMSGSRLREAQPDSISNHQRGCPRCPAFGHLGELESRRFSF